MAAFSGFKHHLFRRTFNFKFEFPLSWKMFKEKGRDLC